MNRIYQGRVVRVETVPEQTDSDENDSPELENWTQLLWQHHELFQDAVNYYTMAFVALGKGLPLDDPISHLRKRMEEAWENFPKKTVLPAKSLQDSVCPWLGIKAQTSFESALTAIVPDSKNNKEINALAVALLAEQTIVMKPKNCANSYWGRFCDQLEREPNWDYSSAEKQRKEAASELKNALWADNAEHRITELAQNIRLSSLVKCDPSAPKLPAKQGRALVNEAFDYLNGVLTGTIPDSKPAKKTNDWLRSNDGFCFKFINDYKSELESLSEERLIDEKPRGGGININKTHAAILFKAFPCDFTLAYLRSAVPKPKEKQTGKKSNKNRSNWRKFENQILALGDDPIKLARTEGTPVFLGFTALHAWETLDSRPGWSDFDKCAFEEALKTLNQFTQKTEEREKRKKEVAEELNYMMGNNPSWQPRKESDEDDDRNVAILGGDPRYNTLKNLLTDLCAEIDEQTTEEILGPTRASLRGLGKLRDAWRGLYEKTNGDPKEEDLRDAVAAFQREHKLDMGYTTFFLKLCEKNYWELWREPTPSEEEERQTNNWASNVIFAAAEARELAEELSRLKEPVRYTPAEPKHSRRLFMFSDITGKHGVKHHHPGRIEVSLASRNSDGKLTPRRVSLKYSAPRLIRDHLCPGEDSKWLQPMMAALGFSEHILAEFTRDKKGKAKEPAVALMPDFVGRTGEIRMLLNFPVDLNVEPLIEKIGKKRLWQKQFNRSNEKNFHLYWPGMKNAPVEAWWQNSGIQRSGITCLAIDLGQRRAADYALLHARTSRTTKTFVELGETGDTHWYAELQSCGSMRLPGENARVFRGQSEAESALLQKQGKNPNDYSGKMLREEFHGTKGRSATIEDYERAVQIARDLLNGEDDVKVFLGDNHRSLSFPEQNDSLIRLFHGALSRYRTWHRWSWRLTSEYQEHWKKTFDEVRKFGSHASWSQLAEKEPDTETAAELLAQIVDESKSLRCILQESLIEIASRALPLRKRTWRWKENGQDSKGKPLHILVSDGESSSSTPWIRGQRGLSLLRIGQLEDFRRAVLSLNRILRHELGSKPEFGRGTLGESLPDPCPEVTEKINRLREERVNQTAHLIIAQALGLELAEPKLTSKQRRAGDIHGQYQVIPGRSPVDFIVLEDLARYTTDKSRSPSENSRLMRWCHRAINEKVKLLAEPFGIPVVEVFASYSSKFDSRTGAPGFRAIEVTAKDRRFWKKTIEKQQTARAVFDCLDNLSANGSNSIRLLLPQNGGPLFATAVTNNQSLQPVRQADINAAVNIGLRAIAGPTCYHAHPRVRLEKSKAGKAGSKWVTRRDNKRETVQFEKKREVSFSNLNDDSSVLKGNNTNLFHDPFGIARFGRATINEESHSNLVHGSALFSRGKGKNGVPTGAVAALEWEVCRWINNIRLEKVGYKLESPSS